MIALIFLTGLCFGMLSAIPIIRAFQKEAVYWANEACRQARSHLHTIEQIKRDRDSGDDWKNQ